MIGMVFIYYAQYQIIRFYLPEYAILKSLGYDWWFFLCMIGQIGAAIITPAFLVAFTLARMVYGVAEATIHLGMTMGLREMVVALVASSGHDRGVERVRDPAPVEGRPDHAVRVTMVDSQVLGPAVVEAVDIHHHYGDGPQRVDVLFDINMQVREGEIVIVTGPSGLGQDDIADDPRHDAPPSEGRLQLLGTDTGGLAGPQLDALRNRIRFLFQKRNLLSSLTALQKRHRRRLHDATRRPRLGRAPGAPSA
jgi:ABC-type transport system involved in cytochrome bd biosynthesis fused ATPase/permease subunit